MPVFQNNVFTLMSSICMPSQESELSDFMVTQEGEAGSLSTPRDNSLHFFLIMFWSFPAAKHEDWKAAKLSVRNIFFVV